MPFDKILIYGFFRKACRTTTLRIDFKYSIHKTRALNPGDTRFFAQRSAGKVVGKVILSAVNVTAWLDAYSTQTCENRAALHINLKFCRRICHRWAASKLVLILKLTTSELSGLKNTSSGGYCYYNIDREHSFYLQPAELGENYGLRTNTHYYGFPCHLFGTTNEICTCGAQYILFSFTMSLSDMPTRWPISSVSWRKKHGCYIYFMLFYLPNSWSPEPFSLLIVWLLFSRCNQPTVT